MLECQFWANVMLRQSRLRASRASPAQKLQGLRVVCSQKLFKGYNFCFLDHSVGFEAIIIFPRRTEFHSNPGQMGGDWLAKQPLVYILCTYLRRPFVKPASPLYSKDLEGTLQGHYF